MTNHVLENSDQNVENETLYSVVPNIPMEPFPSLVERVFNRLSSIATDDELYEKNEVRPNAETIEWAKRVLLRVLPRYYLRTAEIDVFQGEIHVTWERDNKRIVAFLPSPEVLKVYLECVMENGEVKHALHPHVPPQSLNSLLRWLFV